MVYLDCYSVVSTVFVYYNVCFFPLHYNIAKWIMDHCGINISESAGRKDFKFKLILEKPEHWSLFCHINSYCETRFGDNKNTLAVQKSFSTFAIQSRLLFLNHSKYSF